MADLDKPIVTKTDQLGNERSFVEEGQFKVVFTDNPCAAIEKLSDEDRLRIKRRREKMKEFNRSQDGQKKRRGKQGDQAIFNLDGAPVPKADADEDNTMTFLHFASGKGQKPKTEAVEQVSQTGSRDIDSGKRELEVFKYPDVRKEEPDRGGVKTLVTMKHLIALLERDPRLRQSHHLVAAYLGR